MCYLCKYLQVSYEELAADPAATLGAITDFIGVEPFAGFEAERSWNIHERDEKIRDMNAESIQRLTAEQIERFNNVAGDMLDELGYARL